MQIDFNVENYSTEELNRLLTGTRLQLDSIRKELGERRAAEMRENVGKYFVDRCGGLYKILGVAEPTPRLTGQKVFPNKYSVAYIPIDIKEHGKESLNPIEFYQEDESLPVECEEVSKERFIDALNARLEELKHYFEASD